MVIIKGKCEYGRENQRDGSMKAQSPAIAAFEGGAMRPKVAIFEKLGTVIS